MAKVNPSSGKHPSLPNLFSLWRKAKKTNKDSPAWMKYYRRFTLKEIRTATYDFQLKLGHGGVSSAYERIITGSYKSKVAIKRFKSERQFLTEMEVLSNLHHPNVVSLIGYCHDGPESDKFIVYEYLSRGTLRDQLQRRNNSQTILSWKKRLEICIGAARGLEFLHTGNPLIIHRDIETSNILLNDNWVAKISNFEVATGFAGSYGYIDPEYSFTGHFSKESDVNSFGVVLFEVLSARKPLHIERYRDCVEGDRLDDIVEAGLRDQIGPVCLKAYAEMAYKCTNPLANERPTMDVVLKRLLLTLLLQECIEAGIPYSPSWRRSIVPPPRRSGPWIQDSEVSESDYGIEEVASI